jgi:large subunit ribosomal protein L20
MPRVKRGFKARHRRNKWLKMAKGYVGGRSRLYRTARESVQRGLAFAYRDRKAKKRDFRKLWIIRINAAARENGLSYSRLVGGLKKAEVALDRKVLADIAVHDPAGFAKVAELAKGA